MLTRITSAADRMMGSWIVAAVLLVLLAAASVTTENDGNTRATSTSEGAVAFAAPDLVDLAVRKILDSVMASVDIDGFLLPGN